MTSAVKHRARGQALTLVGILTLALIGTVAVVADFGVFYALQQELQSAADAGALAAAWYVPVCQLSWAGDGCQATGPAPQGTCAGARTAGDGVACEVAREFALANLGSLVGMCVGFDPLSSIDPELRGHISGGLANGLAIYTVHIDCNARHLMGNVLPSVPITMQVSANSAVTIGYRGANGDVTNTPTLTLITRLFLVPNPS